MTDPVEVVGSGPSSEVNCDTPRAVGQRFDLEVRAHTAKGRSVYALEPIPSGEIIYQFSGPIYNRNTCPEFSEALQVGPDSWMWSSGLVDDLVNHSCDPNSVLLEVDGLYYLKSIRDISIGEELGFDYSTSMVDEPWALEGCLCGAAACRKIVGNFIDSVDPKMQEYYYKNNYLLPHVRSAYEKSISVSH